MIQPASTETMYQALFTLLAATQVNGAAAFVTTSRKLPPAQSVAAARQPALYMLETQENVTEKAVGMALEEHEAGAIVLFRNTGAPDEVPSTQLNTLRDAVVNQLRNFTLSPGGALPVQPLAPGMPQTLGGLVYHCRIVGKILKNEGLQNQQGAIVFPISILAGM